MAVLPSADSATEWPCSAKGPTTSLPTSFDPCCANCASASSGETSNAEKHMTAATKVGNLCDKSDEIDANMTSSQIVPKRPLADRPKGFSRNDGSGQMQRRNLRLTVAPRMPACS